MQRNGKISNLWAFYFLADLLAIVFSYYITWAIRFRSAFGERFSELVTRILATDKTGTPGYMLERFYLENASRIILILIVTLCAIYALRELYSERRFLRPRPIAWNIIVANAIALAVFYTYFYIRRNVFHPRSFFGTVMVINIVLCISFRSIMDRFLVILREKFGIDRCRAILVGVKGPANYIRGFVEALHPHGIQIVSDIELDETKTFERMLTVLKQTIKENRIDMIILADVSLDMSQIMQIFEMADQLDLPVKVLSDKMDILMSRANISVDLMDNIPLVHFEAPSTAARLIRTRRVIFRLIAVILTLILLPLLAVIALVVKVTSKGPILFTQERIGVDRNPFMMYKFRTMYDKADELQAQIEEFNESGEGLFKIREDPRVTPVGRFLRRFSLDELPQLFNVISGKMALIGPRPLPRRDFENYYEDWHYSRHTGLPGLTCLWQVSGRSDIDFHNMCILDVYYLRNQNWVLDVKIFFKTFWVVMFAKGAY